MEARFYKENGLCIPLFSSNGKKRQHARVSSSLRNKPMDFLLAIVADYAGKNKRQEFESNNRTKASVSNWIEMAETRALGASLSSKLGFEEWAEFEFTLDTGETIDTKVHNKRKELPEEAEEGREDVKRKKSDDQVPSPDEPEQTQGERDINNASQPAKHKQTSGDQPLSPPLTPHKPQQSRRNVLGQFEQEKAEKKAEEEAAKNTINEDKPEAGDPRSERHFMKDIGLSRIDPQVATGTVKLNEHGRVRILTMTTRKHHIETQTTLHDTGITDNILKDPSRRIRHDAKPFLKPGRHGPNGDFERADDPDLATGVGHNYDPDDLEKYEDHMQTIAEFYKEYPTYPNPVLGQEVDPEVIKMWKEEHNWYRAFKAKYTGVRGDQWVCGCRIAMEETGFESEEE